MGQNKTIIGIDPGTRILGWGVITSPRPLQLALVDYGVIRISQELDTPQRLLAIHRAIHEILKAKKPDIMAIERVFYGKSFQSALKIGEARGICLLAAAELDLPTFSYTPAEVKSAVTGNGQAHKSQVQSMVTRVLKLSGPPRPADAADALACAICHMNRL